MDGRSHVQQRSGEFKWQREVLPRHAGEKDHKRRRWLRMCRLLALGILILPLSERLAEAQGNQIRTRFLPLSLCSTSVATFRLSGLSVPTNPTILCPVTDEAPLFYKSGVNWLRVYYLNKTGSGTIKVSACSQRFDTQAETCTVARSGTERAINRTGNISFLTNELVGVWGRHTDTTAFGYVKVEFSGTFDNPDQIIAGVFLF